MINTQYKIDCSDWFDEGGYCQVYPIKGKSNWIFKEFHTKKKARGSYNYHKQLVKFDLAPKIYSSICRLKFADYGDICFDHTSDWGYITEYAKTHEANTIITMKDIQNLVDEIYQKTGLKFWDCHWYNVGIVKRKNKNKIVCIDTGEESFQSINNSWRFAEPGPKCNYCDQYQCKCTED